MIAAGSLLVVVAGHTLLAESSLELSQDQARLSAAQATNRQLVSQVASAEQPSRIVTAATQDGLVPPGHIVQVPHVPLNAPLGSSASTNPVGTHGASTSTTTTSTPSGGH